MPCAALAPCPSWIPPKTGPRSTSRKSPGYSRILSFSRRPIRRQCRVTSKRLPTFPHGGSLTPFAIAGTRRSEEHTSELQSQFHLVCRLLLEKKKNKKNKYILLKKKKKKN